MSLIVTYIAYGSYQTGGYHHEMQLTQALAQELNGTLTTKRYTQKQKGFLGAIQLWWFAFQSAGKGVNITVQRLFLPVLLKAILTNSKVILVFHHYDVREKMGVLYHANFGLIKHLLALNLSRVHLVVVAKFWVDFWTDLGVGEAQISLFPNLFNAEEYRSFHTIEKQNKVFLGQYSIKNNPVVLNLAKQLHLKGYEVFFSTVNPKEEGHFDGYTIKHYNRVDYLTQIAQSKATVCMIGIHEGWNRVAHESILLHTPVISTPSGGLTELVVQSGQQLVHQSDEIVALIEKEIHFIPNQTFIERYHIGQISYYAQPIVRFCLSNGIS